MLRRDRGSTSPTRLGGSARHPSSGSRYWRPAPCTLVTAECSAAMTVADASLPPTVGLRHARDSGPLACYLLL